MRKILITLGSVAAVATPIVAVVSCGDPITGEGEHTDINNEGAPAGFYWISIMHKDHAHRVLVKDGEDAPQYNFDEWIFVDQRHTVPEGAFSDMTNQDVLDLIAKEPSVVDEPMPRGIAEIEENAFANSDLSALENFNLDNVLNVRSGAFKNAVLPNSFTLGENTIIDDGAFEGATDSIRKLQPRQCIKC